ncbi:MAG: glycosyltransferase, partial [Chthoniobacterales bacterium]
MKNRKRPPQPLGHFEELPVVTVQLPLFNEIYVVERLLKAVSELDYPRERLQIQVLDDSTDETRDITRSCVERLKAKGFDAELIQRTDRIGYKAGALEYGLASARGDYICILDADFVPQPELLQKTVHFFTDPKVGMIQTRWGHINR